MASLIKTTRIENIVAQTELFGEDEVALRILVERGEVPNNERILKLIKEIKNGKFDRDR